MLLRSAHLPSAIVAAAGKQSTDALPAYSTFTRARIAAQLRAGLRGGSVKPSDVLRALGNGPAGADRYVVALGRRLDRRRRGAPAQRIPHLPKPLRAPVDPRFDGHDMRSLIAAWLRAFAVAGDATAIDLADTVRQGATAGAETIRRLVGDRLRRTMARHAYAAGREGVSGLDPEWMVIPRLFATGLEDHASASAAPVLMEPESWTGMGVSTLEASEHTPGFIELCSVLMGLRLSVLGAILPTELATEGAAGGMLFEDLAAYAPGVRLSDASIVLPEGMREHLDMEYGFDVGAPEQLARLRRWYALHERVSSGNTFPSLARGRSSDTAAVAKALRALALRYPRATEPLRCMAAWVRFAFRKKSPPAAVSSLDEDGWLTGVHIFSADLTGFEDGVIQDMADSNANCGASGVLEVSAPGGGLLDALDVALSDVCRITVLTRLLSDYVEAFS